MHLPQLSRFLVNSVNVFLHLNEDGSYFVVLYTDRVIGIFSIFSIRSLPMTSKPFDMVPPEDITYCGPFMYTRGRMFYRDKYETLWEIIPTDDSHVPLTITPIAHMFDGNSNE
jgi:hypothetical protein